MMSTRERRSHGDLSLPLAAKFIVIVLLLDRTGRRCGGFVQILDNVSLSGLTIFDFRVKLVGK